MKGKIFALCLAGLFLTAALILAACGTAGGGKNMKSGTYTATTIGFTGPLTVEVKTSANAITGVRVTDHVDTPGISDWAIEAIPARIVEHQSLAVDIVTGVTLTSRAILHAVGDCLVQAGAELAAFERPIQKTTPPAQTLTADVVVVGGGGAGLGAAVSAAEGGASVILVEKAGFLGGNSIAAGGIINTSWRARQDTWPARDGTEALILAALAEKPVNAEHRAVIERVRAEFAEFKASNRTIFDSPSWHALQTWNGGDKVADLRMVQVMTNNSQAAVEWLIGMGMETKDGVVQIPGSLYQRGVDTVLPNGTGFIKAFRGALDKQKNYTQLMETTATGLIMEGGRVVGVNAVNNLTGQRFTLKANKGVVLATGGFAANVEMRQLYCEGDVWPYLGRTLNSTNVRSVTGDGIYFARDAGVDLVNMEHIQLLHITNPRTGSTGCLSTAGVNVLANLFVNKDGKRFVAEDGRRDEISRAIMAQSGGVMHMIFSADYMPDPNVDFTLDGRSVAYMLENKLAGYVKADTLEELARLIGVDANNLAASVREFNSHADSQTRDQFGRVLFGMKFENGPWYSYPRAPATHHTMGGVRIDEYARALKADGTPVPGLYAAGEITGVLHGANRLGGNAMTDFAVFGRLAGASAATGR